MTLRRLSFVTMTALLVGFVNTSWAQVPRILLTSTPLQIRATGVTETVGDLALSVVGVGQIPAGAVLTVSLIPFTAAISNDPVFNGVNVRLNGEPIPGAILAVGPTPGNTLIITFTKTITIIPGDLLRIGAIRVNAQAAGVSAPEPIYARLTVSPRDAIQIEIIDTLPVGFPQPTLDVEVSPPANLPQCRQTSTVSTIIVTERFTAVFTTDEQENLLSSTPTATNPTQVQIVLGNIPGGLTVDVPVSIPLDGSFTPATLDLNPDLSTPPTEEGPEGTVRYRSAMTREAIHLIYDVAGTPDWGFIKSATVAITFTTTGRIVSQRLGCVTAQARLAPLSTTPDRAITDDEGPSRILPRFIDPFQPSPASDIVCVVRCDPAH
ncbi:MAG: hypothetical protein HYR55_12650 [Acidobacteria bacterium]|nr:hypothetical protein [Acidobacteriota bacterium]MBI3656516.1 hypothetical protein [Acidobacteriota bacterium]